VGRDFFGAHASLDLRGRDDDLRHLPFVNLARPKLDLRRESTTGSTNNMPATHWDELSRSEQRLLIRLFGCGSLRNQDPKIIEQLRRRALIDDEGALTTSGMQVFTGALYRQQADNRRRAGLAA
jgi:hypothetical protein